MDIEILPATTHNVIDLAVYFGPLTGVKIATQGQIRQRTRRWNRTPEASTTIGSSDADLSARDAVSYAVLRTLEMQRIDDLTVRDLRTASLVTDAIGDSIITHGFKSGWGMRMKKGFKHGRRYAAESRAAGRTATVR